MGGIGVRVAVGARVGKFVGEGEGVGAFTSFEIPDGVKVGGSGVLLVPLPHALSNVIKIRAETLITLLMSDRV